jgi:hypothetical protein
LQICPGKFIRFENIFGYEDAGEKGFLFVLVVVDVHLHFNDLKTWA